MHQVTYKALLFFTLFIFGITGELTAQELTVSKNQKYLQTKEGKPFFWLGDTAWELFHRLNREEADLYLQDRASKGFTVIQAVVLAELNGLNDPNPYGDKPLLNNDPTKPNEKYFQHVDYIVNKVASLGMYVGMLPTWGDKFNKKWGQGPEIFTPENARAFGEYLGKRYQNKPIIWILGGDRVPADAEDFAIVRAMAAGLEKVHKGRQLMTYHPEGGRNSSELFPDEKWLDLHVFQSGHGAKNSANYTYNVTNLNLKPLKPTIDAEPRYEDHPVDWKPDSLGWFDDFDVRQAGYWSLLSGAAGHTYGDHNIWQMWTEERGPISWARTHWKEALEHNGSAQMGYMKKLFEARPWYKLQPEQNLIKNANPEGGAYQKAALADDKSFALIYSPYGKALSVDLNNINGNVVKAWWFNPRDGRTMAIGDFSEKKVTEFKPHTFGRGSDWVLVLENKQLNLPMPK
ncbi:glycoside hydrolase family 140 protein [Pontibacter toksunensis]|uniref:Glycoside hydrolase family 140 protein n=1 Tax=Pontibacter toksunensis TaxID=1332631 RepID=A0ABW6BZJ1_9BACT